MSLLIKEFWIKTRLIVKLLTCRAPRLRCRAGCRTLWCCCSWSSEEAGASQTAESPALSRGGGGGGGGGRGKGEERGGRGRREERGGGGGEEGGTFITANIYTNLQQCRCV